MVPVWAVITRRHVLLIDFCFARVEKLWQDWWCFQGIGISRFGHCWVGEVRARGCSSCAENTPWSEALWDINCEGFNWGRTDAKCVYTLVLFSNLSIITFCLSISSCSKTEIILKKVKRIGLEFNLVWCCLWIQTRLQKLDLKLFKLFPNHLILHWAGERGKAEHCVGLWV